MDSLKKFYSTRGYAQWSEEKLQHDRVIKLLSEIDIILRNKKKLKVLDIGSGAGDLIYLIYKKYPHHRYFGCDIADGIVKKNIKQKPEIRWSVEDFNNKASYQTNTFDLIIAGEIIEHLYDTDNFFLETRRILKKKGILILTTPNLSSWIDRMFLLFGLQPHSTEVSNVSRKFGREAYYNFLNIKEDVEPAGHLRCFTWSALHSMVSFYNFKIKKHIGCHSHNILINRLITNVYPKLAQNQLVVAVK